MKIATYNVNSILNPVLVQVMGPGYLFNLYRGRPLVRNSARPGFLGPTYNPFRPDISKMFARELEPGMKRELAARGDEHTIRLKLVEGA